MNIVVVSGRIKHDIECYEYRPSKYKCRFEIDCRREFAENEYDSLLLEAWGNKAQLLESAFKKGDMISVKGRLKCDKSDKVLITVEQYEFPTDY